MLGEISYLHEKFTWRGWTFNKYCDSQSHKWPPMMIPAPWYPHTCVAFSQIIPGLDFVASSVWCKWCYVTSDMNLYKTVGSIFGVLSLDLGLHTLEKAKSWAGLWRSPPGKDLRPPSNTPLRVNASTFGSLWYVHP